MIEKFILNCLNFFQRLADLLSNVSENPNYAIEKKQLFYQFLDLNIKLDQLQAITMLPPEIRTKIDALKKIQLDLLNKEAEFHKQVHSLETEFQKGLTGIFEERRRIVNGFPVSAPVDLSDAQQNETTAVVAKGIPEFWLTVFKMAPFLQIMFREQDEPALKCLLDIRSVLVDEPRPGFVLEFEFGSNDYFTNPILTKRYEMECVPDGDQLSSFNGFEICDSTGCEIHWNEGRNLTLAVIDGTERLVDSFFNFFNPKKLVANADSVTYKQFMEYDFEIGYYIKERVVPRAVLFFSGEILDSDFVPSQVAVD